MRGVRRDLLAQRPGVSRLRPTGDPFPFVITQSCQISIYVFTHRLVVVVNVHFGSCRRLTAWEQSGVIQGDPPNAHASGTDVREPVKGPSRIVYSCECVTAAEARVR